MMPKLNYSRMIVVASLFFTGCASTVDNSSKSVSAVDRGVFLHRGTAASSRPAMNVTQTKISGIITNTDAINRKFSLNPDIGSEFVQSSLIWTIEGAYPSGTKPEITVNVSQNSQIQWNLLLAGKKVTILCREDQRDRSLEILEITVR